MKLLVTTVLLSGSMLASVAAFAQDPKAECARAYEQAQTLRKGGQLIEARERAIACSQPVCSKAMVPECAAWASELQTLIPTIVVAVKDASGADAVEARIALGGKEWLSDGKAVPINPGPHSMTVTLGGESKAVRVVAREGERARMVEVSFLKAATVAPIVAVVPAPPSTHPPTGTARLPESAAAPSAPEAVEPANTGRGPRVAGIVVGSAGIVGLGIGAAFGIVTLSKVKQSYAKGCSATTGVCAKGSEGSTLAQDAVGTRTVTYVLLGVGAASLGAGLAIFFTAPKPQGPAKSGWTLVDVAASVDPGGLSLRGRW